MTTGMTEERYALIQRLLHWLIAFMVLGLLVGGWIMHEFKAKDLPKGLYSQIYDLHKSIGVVVLLLMAFRIIARLIHGAPAPHPSLANCPADTWIDRNMVIPSASPDSRCAWYRQSVHERPRPVEDLILVT